MEQDQIPLPPVEGNAPGGASGQAALPADSNPRRKAGRRSTADEVEGYLASKGLMSVPSDGGGDGEQMDAPAPFDEASTRSTLVLLVDAYADIKHASISSSVLESLGPDFADQFRPRTMMGTQRREAFVNAGVAVARRHGTSIAPEAVLVALALNEVREFRAIRSDLARLAKARHASQSSSP